MAVMNKGGIRCNMPSGDITRGLIMQMLPFDNRIVLLDIKGSDLAAGFDVMAGRLGDGVSNATAVYDPETKNAARFLSAASRLTRTKHTV